MKSSNVNDIDSLNIILNAAAVREKQIRTLKIAEDQKQTSDLNAIQNLSSYKKLKEELLPFLEAYLYAARKCNLSDFYGTKTELSIQADIEQNVTVVSMTYNKDNFFRYTVTDKGYWSLEKSHFANFISEADFKLPYNCQFTDIKKVLEDIGHALACQNDDFKKYFRYYITNNDDTSVKCSKEQPIPSISPKR